MSLIEAQDWSTTNPLKRTFDEALENKDLVRMKMSDG